MNASASVYPRDLRGHGADPPHARWPGGARIAVQFVLNYEEGGENSVLHGDPTSETFLSELITAQAYENGTDEERCTSTARVCVCESFASRCEKASRTVRRRDGARSVSERSEFSAAITISPARARWIHYQNRPEAAERRHLDIAPASSRS